MTKTSVFTSLAGHIQGSLFLAIVLLSGGRLCHAADVENIDDLTHQWLQIEKQQRQLTLDWQEQEPTIRQRITLLQAEKKQLKNILSNSNESQDDVEDRRNALLAEQNQLEKQQASVDSVLHGLMKRVDSMYSELPPLVKNSWDKEQLALDGSKTSSKQLQVLLAKLSKLEQFDAKITVNEGVITSPKGNEVVVKQLYLGAHYAWFTNRDGSYAGIGYPSQGEWQWKFNDSLDSEKINHAIAVYERRTQPDFVALPVTLAPSSAVQQGGR